MPTAPPSAWSQAEANELGRPSPPARGGCSLAATIGRGRRRAASGRLAAERLLNTPGDGPKAALHAFARLVCTGLLRELRNLALQPALLLAGSGHHRVH